MSLARVMARNWEENRLFSVLLELTYRCNLDCFFCYNDLGLAGTPLARGQWLDLLAELADLQVLNLTLSGGEPLASPDFFAIGARARELGFVVRIKSNGHALRGEIARRVRDEVDPFIVEVSLHGATAAVHDRQTHVPGSFERLLANLEELSRLGLRVKINSTLTAWNEDEIEGMLDLAEGLGLPLQIDPEVTPRDDGDTSPLAVTASRQGVLRLFAVQEERARAAGGGPEAPAVAPGSKGLTVALGGDEGATPVPVSKHCGAGSSGIAVDPFGNVYPCVQWRKPLGSLHRQSLREIWGGSPALGEVRRTTEQAKRMVDSYGETGPLLNFCPGTAATRTGDPLEVYPSALERAALAEEAHGGAGKKPLLPILR
jgi:AdoMet-dependent heme synthase